MKIGTHVRILAVRPEGDEYHGKSGVLRKIDGYATDGDAFGVQFDDRPDGDVVYFWRRELEQIAAFHTPAIIATLARESELFGVDATSYVVYGSPLRPMSSIWARVHPDALYIPTNRQQTGYHTYVAVPQELSPEVIKSYELDFVSRPA